MVDSKAKSREEKLDSVKSSLDEMMEMQFEKLNVIVKKSTIHSVLWTIAAIAFYLIWPEKWYFWIPTVMAMLCIASLVFVQITRKKLLKNKNR